MAQSKRVALSVPPEVDVPLTHLSKLINTPKTAIITEFLLELTPQVQLMIQAIEQAKSGHRTVAMETLQHLLAKANVKMAQAELELIEMKGKSDATT